jgi:4,5-DOPA dioxygenase extradiol
MNRLPTLFISHGSPMLALQDSPARRFLAELGKSLPRPRAILVASAHWETLNAPALSFAEHPETIHDFGGFPAELFAIEYPAPGAPDVAARAAALLEGAGLAVKRSPDRGLDHGAWVPLRLMYPEADIPMTQISILRGAAPADHEKIGQALTALRDEGVLVIGSGSLTHNLYEISRGGAEAPAPSWVTEFRDWMNTNLDENQRDALRDYRRRAPHAERNHPTDEHLLPLFVAMGAAGEAAQAKLLHTSIEYGVLAMDVYAFS